MARRRFATSRRLRRRVAFVLRHAVLLGWTAVVIFPLYWMFVTSIKSPAEWFGWPPVWWPETPSFDNWRRVWVDGTLIGSPLAGTEVIGPLEALANSFLVALAASLLALLAGTLLAWGASRHRMVSDGTLLATLALRMIPPFVIGGPLMIWFTLIGLVDTYLGLVLVYALTIFPYAALVMKSFIDDIPPDYEQAAEMLGARRWQVLVEIVLPLLRPGLAATFLFLFILAWSEHFLGLILSQTDVATLPMHLNRFAGNGGGHGYQAALSLGATLPLIVVGLAIRRHLGRGLSFGMVGRYRR
jgi:multiple sugar transport system permease protein